MAVNPKRVEALFDAPPSKAKRIQSLLLENVPLISLVVTTLIFSLLSEAFWTQRNLTNLSRQVSINSILACGMTVLILLNGIDLGIGSVLALAAVIAATLQVSLTGAGLPIFMLAAISMAAAVALGAVVGLLNGYLVARFRMPAFVVTLASLVMGRGLALLISGGQKIAPLSDVFRSLGTSFIPQNLSLILLVGILVSLPWAYRRKSMDLQQLFASALIVGLFLWIFVGYQGIPSPVLIAFSVYMLVQFLLTRTVFGRSVYAIGGNREAARLCGIPIEKITTLSYVLMGSLVGLSAIIECGRIDAGDPLSGSLYELDAIAAVVIGGTSLQGGIGTLPGTLLGALLMGVVNNGMSLLNVETHFQMVLKGGIILLAVFSDVMSKRKE